MDRAVFTAQRGANEDENDVAMTFKLLHAAAEEGNLLLEREKISTAAMQVTRLR